MDQKFTKDERLKKRSEFKNVFDNGRSFKNNNINFYVWFNNSQNSRIGIVARKGLGNSVKRNRIKRFFRESFRKNKYLLNCHVDIIIIPRFNFKNITLELAEANLTNLFKKIKKC